MKNKIAPYVLIVAIAAVSGSFIGEYFFALKPCILCLYQRYIWIIILAVSIEFLFYRPVWIAIVFLLLLNAGIAGYQVGVEQKIFALPSICQSPPISANTLQQLSDQVMNTPPVRCDKVEWELYGISMAGYNALLCILMSIFLLLGINGKNRHGR